MYVDLDSGTVVNGPVVYLDNDLVPDDFSDLPDSEIIAHARTFGVPMDEARGFADTWCEECDSDDGEHMAHCSLNPANMVNTRECDLEFGPHDHNDAECAQALDIMENGYGDPYQDDRDAYNREAEEEILGRPLFPNEY